VRELTGLARSLLDILTKSAQPVVTRSPASKSRLLSSLLY